jgi:hypothetical protein
MERLLQVAMASKEKARSRRAIKKPLKERLSLVRDVLVPTAFFLPNIYFSVNVGSQIILAISATNVSWVERSDTQQ